MGLGRLSDLTMLNLQHNMFSGSIPESLGQCSKLTDLRLSKNYQLTGSVPLSFGRLSNLQTLALCCSGLTAWNSEGICQLNLTRCYLQENNFKCPPPLPSCNE